MRAQFHLWSNIKYGLHCINFHTKLTATRQHYVEIIVTELHLNWSRNVGSMGRNSFTSWSKV